ncbi:hypothetical protein [uncultured Psychroserpens sp.]|uniref:hypothetical protein n=1 Tax=uncultured Psychroserpens sp. TaxID=255436 RepID=UPI00262DD2B0|nr:hypothetical protein [uncultured Psychroserpens sp.]
MKDTHKIISLIVAGFLTVIMAAVVPTETGTSMLFIITGPFFIVIGFVLAFLYKRLSRKIRDRDVKEITFMILMFFIIVFSVLAFPFKNHSWI